MTDTLMNHTENARESSSQTAGTLSRAIKKQTAKFPSDLFLWAAAGAIGASAYLEITGHQEKSRFIGQWVSPFLLFGLYTKLVKVAGSDCITEMTGK